MEKKSKKQTNYDSPFARRISKLREERNLSQEEVCQAIGIKQRSSLSQYENGEVLPKIDVLIKIADFYNVSYNYLLGKSENRAEINYNIGETLKISDITIATIQSFNEMDKMDTDRVIQYNDILNKLFEKKYLTKIISHISLYINNFNNYRILEQMDDEYKDQRNIERGLKYTKWCLMQNTEDIFDEILRDYAKKHHNYEKEKFFWIEKKEEE